MTNTRNSRSTEADEPHWIEWATGVIAAVLVLVMIGWVGKQALLEKEMPPEFGIAITAKGPIEGGFRVEFDIANKANTTAAAVVVRGEILDGETAVEDADVTFDYVPAQSKSSGAILFSQDPGARTIRIRAIAYTDP